MTKQQIQQLQRKYDDELEAAGMMTGRKLNKLISASQDLQKAVFEAGKQQKGGTAVKSDDIRT